MSKRTREPVATLASSSSSASSAAPVSSWTEPPQKQRRREKKFVRPAIEELIPPEHRSRLDTELSVQLSSAAVNAQLLQTADGTNYTYSSQCVQFLKWAASNHPGVHLSDTMLANYLTWWLGSAKEGKKPHSSASIGSMASAIVGGLRNMYMDSPYKVWFANLNGANTKGVRRGSKMKGRRDLAAHEKVYQVQGLIPQKVNRICSFALDCGTPRDLRDAAMFALNALTWFRGDTMYRLRLDNLEEFDGTLFVLPDSLKNSQTGARIKGIPLIENERYPSMCPVRTMLLWLAVRGFSPGPLFCMTDKTGIKLKHNSQMNRAHYVDRISNALIQTGIATQIGYREWGTHSFRRGGATWAAYNGIALHEIQEWGNWRSISAAVRYVDKVGFLKSPVAKLYEGGGVKDFDNEEQYQAFVEKSDIVHKLEKSYVQWEKDEDRDDIVGEDEDDEDAFDSDEGEEEEDDDNDSDVVGPHNRAQIRL